MTLKYAYKHQVLAQGGCSSSMLADLFLYYYECNYKNNNLQLHKYIDDIITYLEEHPLCAIPDVRKHILESYIMWIIVNYKICESLRIIKINIIWKFQFRIVLLKK